MTLTLQSRKCHLQWPVQERAATWIWCQGCPHQSFFRGWMPSYCISNLPNDSVQRTFSPARPSTSLPSNRFQLKHIVPLQIEFKNYWMIRMANRQQHGQYGLSWWITTMQLLNLRCCKSKLWSNLFACSLQFHFELFGCARQGFLPNMILRTDYRVSGSGPNVTKFID